MNTDTKTKIYNIKVTNFYSNYMKKKGDDLTDCIAISNAVPDWFKDKGQHMRQLAPCFELIQDYKKGNISKDQYAQLCLNKFEKNFRLEKLDMLDILNKLDNKTICIMEKPDEFSHSNIFKFLFKKAGYNINWEVI
jgi:hypothetical protein